MQSQGLRQVQKQTQNLVLAPQLRQSLKILQVPALELRSAILEELQTNPLLEELGNNDESLDAEEVEPLIRPNLYSIRYLEHGVITKEVYCSGY